MHHRQKSQARKKITAAATSTTLIIISPARKLALYYGRCTGPILKCVNSIKKSHNNCPVITGSSHSTCGLQITLEMLSYAISKLPCLPSVILRGWLYILGTLPDLNALISKTYAYIESIQVGYSEWKCNEELVVSLKPDFGVQGSPWHYTPVHLKVA